MNGMATFHEADCNRSSDCRLSDAPPPHHHDEALFTFGDLVNKRAQGRQAEPSLLHRP